MSKNLMKDIGSQNIQTYSNNVKMYGNSPQKFMIGKAIF